MSKIVPINDNFSMTPKTQFVLVDEKTCECLRGRVLVMAKGATGIAATSDAQVVVMIAGGKAVQKHKDAQASSVDPKGIVELLPVPAAPKRQVDTGASRASGCANAGDLQKQLKSARR